MTISEFGIKKKITTYMVFLGLVLLGLISLFRLGLDLMPDIEIPSIMVITTYRGTGPEEIETSITEPIEAQMATVSNLDTLESSSKEGASIVTLKFDWGTNLEEAANEVRDKLGLAESQLPEAADKPFIFKFNMAMIPILMIGANAKESYPKLYDLLDDEVKKPLERIGGVAKVDIHGGLEREIQVSLNRQRLEAYQIPLSQIVSSLQAANLSWPGGHLKTGKLDYLVRTPEELKISEIRDVMIGNYHGNPVYLKDIAEVSDTFKEKSGEVYINQQPGVMLTVSKQSGTNTVQVANKVLKELPLLEKNLPPDVNLQTIYDSSNYIKLSVANLRNTLLIGGILVILIILFFLGSFRSALIVAVSIPISLILTFILMSGAGFTLNMVSLSSLGIAIGMVVDAAIVIFENIFRHRENKEGKIEAAISGANEVGTAVVASIASIIAIFVPLFFIGGFVGIMFHQLALCITFTLFASVLTALLLIPLLTTRFLHTIEEEKGVLSRFFRAGEGFFRRLERIYQNFLSWSLAHKKRMVFISSGIFLLGLLLIPLVGTEFIPEMDQGMMMFNIELPVGTRYEKTGKVAKAVEEIIRQKVPEKESTLVRWGRSSEKGGMGTLMGQEEISSTGMVMIKLVDKAKRRRIDKQIGQSLKPLFNFPEGEVRYQTEDPMASMVFGGRPLSLEIRGHSLEEGKKLAKEVAKILGKIKGVSDVEISRKEGSPELRVYIDREKVSHLGLSVFEVAKAIETAIAGTVATKYREGGEEYDIRVRVSEEGRKKPEDLAGLILPTQTGGKVRLSEVAQIKEETGPTAIARRDQERIIDVSGEIYGRDLGSVAAEAKGKFKNLKIPTDFGLSFKGGREEQQKSFQALAMAMLLGVVLVYMVMASQFESLLDPFIIMFALPFAMIGVVWTLLLTGQTLSLPSFLGLVMLGGIVMENGIVLISYINLMRRENNLYEAIKIGGSRRLRPILMTTFTTIFGLLPLTLARGEATEFFKPLAISVIGGLFVGTFVTLLFIPTLYAIFEERIKGSGLNN
ncbi:MAG: hypothetical protein COZ37_06840 [bacterium (Candidatus Ratteibacteria) CG_4_10_14_3_um_filter_41_18]|uniref:AcrB/AcrD/AcrF family protein n=4 Tax=Candidatus Ratteibacteria TaxID=2979319 RepID=A0A2M7YHD7_9BACT|nr:MAG: hypothetical protein AUJ76_01940 [Candidatus Omnitrophica bacterium CG1_02_41_171]PIV64611.1 MAG: hypothetical protein COS11_01310 [bacterium (Candidatus Ratteibacteria) CG01_land_8_20_14_3_00_40_19]PIW33770.1 MAG: hypothetical protein COW28_02775 [bacterium (Candidatus Ratteibacteria) CG15_BIG_FIL_POST_REV_8_21_14_020_41_12]PIW74031.1 MAG: hypothetical protein CO004_02880 [bacterium (Candidatus Ratteibacteria) CG_4_8_14_3_um_filter_41_36]PIX76645.1 MAG: hypothetical protein COZ37_06840